MGVRGTDREGAQPPQCPPGSIPPAPGDRIGMGKQRAGSLPSSIPAPGLITGFAAGSMGCLSHLLWDVAQVVLASTFLPLLPPMAGELRVCILEETVPCCAMPCAKQESVLV